MRDTGALHAELFQQRRHAFIGKAEEVQEPGRLSGGNDAARRRPTTAGTLPFAISFGDYKAEQLDVPFALTERSDRKQSTFDFSRTFLSPTGVPFTLHKTYLFDKDEYLFELRVTIENSVNDFPALDFGGFAYTLTMGPQIGPHYAKLDNRNDFRNYAYYADGKRQD